MGSLCGPGWFTATGRHQLVGQRQRDFKLADCNGEELTLSALKGKVVVLTFFGTWSDQCRDHAARMGRLWEDYGADGLVVIGITAETDSVRVRRFVEENDVRFPVLIGGVGVFKQYKVGGVPDTFCIDKRGIVRFRTVGYKPDNDTRIRETAMQLAAK